MSGRRFDQKANGAYSICLTDHQGPTDTAYLIWSSTDFITAMFEHPQEVHHLIRLVTDLTIEFVKTSRRRNTKEGVEQNQGAGGEDAGGKAGDRGEFWKDDCELYAGTGGSIERTGQNT